MEFISLHSSLAQGEHIPEDLKVSVDHPIMQETKRRMDDQCFQSVENDLKSVKQERLYNQKITV